ncbi:MAG: hypothetical protein KBT40_06550, partial [bacterium]|nr:hypothetical protein [Candidatus Minthenecus merdequi]
GTWIAEQFIQLILGRFICPRTPALATIFCTLRIHDKEAFTVIRGWVKSKMLLDESYVGPVGAARDKNV